MGIIMIIGLVSHLIISWLTYFTFCIAGVDLKWDLLSCFHEDTESGEVRLRNTRQLDTPVDMLENALASQSKYLKKLDERQFHDNDSCSEIKKNEHKNVRF